MIALQKMFGAATEGPHRDGEAETERAQALVRVVLASVATLYILIGAVIGFLPDGSILPLTAYPAVFIVVSIALLLAITRRPGTFPARRLLAMVHDYAAITFTLIIGGEYVSPVYAILLWVTVGNGMRYGSGYLAIATGFALASLAIVAYSGAYWSEHPYFVATLVLTTIIVPAYAHLLLRNTRRAHDTAIAANLTKSRFFAQASHDLRQPVHAISLFTACLRDSGLTPDQGRMVDNIDRALQSVSRLFRSLLDISTLDSGKVRPRAEAVPLGELLRDVAERNREAARQAGVTLRIVPTRLHVRIDPDLLATMVQNIISNAVKYAPGAPVLIGCRRRGGSLTLEVHDRGRGIPADHLPRVFDEFYRVPEPGRDVEGVGLGLSIVRRIGGIMGLDASIVSRSGRGTVVRIAGLSIVPAEERTVVQRPAGPVTPLSGMRILLIEDDRDVLLATTALLERWGCSVQAETAMPEGVGACDLVITDFDLNGPLTGAACIARVAAMLGRPVPAVIMTGHDEGRVRQELGDDAITVVAKPVHPSTLRAVLVAQKLRMEAREEERDPALFLQGEGV